MTLNEKTILTIEMLSFTMSILLERIPYDEYYGVRVLNFIEGVLMGLFVVMNLFYLRR